jgi:hypothetical protein
MLFFLSMDGLAPSDRTTEPPRNCSSWDHTKTRPIQLADPRSTVLAIVLPPLGIIMIARKQTFEDLVVHA